MTLRVTLAGRVGIEVDGDEVDAAGLGRPGRLALAYLICERHRSVPRDELAEVLWGAEMPRSSDQMLRGVAFRLRALLAAAGLDAPATLTTASGAFRLHLPADAVVDVEEAAAALEGAEAALAAGYPGAARAQAQAALTVAARQFAPTTAGAWVERRQAELGELHLRAMEALARAAVAEGDWAGAVGAAEKVIDVEPFRESAYLCLMDAHAGAGNRGEALRAYERCREVLVEELGVDPSPPTEAAYLRLLGDEPAPAAASSPTALPLPPALAPMPGAFMVGRQGEAEALEAALKRAGVEGRQGVLVGGEPGAGKTTLVAAAARAAHAAGARVLYGRCDEELALAYQPFAQALGHYVASAPTAELRAHVAAHGGALARLVPELSRRLPEAVAPPATEAEADRWALFEAVADVLARASAATTVALVLDDLHWAAPPTLALLRHLLTDQSPAALLVVGTYRHTDTAPTSALAATLADLRRAPAVERISLGGLDAKGVAAFLKAAGAEDDDGALARALHAHTAGNPFFVGELLRHLAETGATYRRQAPWSYYAEAEGLDVPEGAVEVVARRLGRLSPEANRALVLAAVTGTEFGLDVIEAAEPEEPDTVLDGLEEAQAASLVVELDRPGQYRFAHALVRHAIYGSLSGVRRARLHRHVGEALESLPGNDASRLPALAHHFAEAAVAGTTDKAADYAMATAEQALAQGAAENAVAALDRGLEAVELHEPPDLERKAALLLALARVHLFLDHAPARYRAAAMATEIARELGSAELLARATLAYVREGRDADFVCLLDEALDALGDGVPALRAMLLSQVAISGVRPLEVSDRLSEEALALARRSDDPVALGVVLRGRYLVLLGSTRAGELLETAEELVSAAPPGAWQGWRHGYRFRAVARLINADRVGFDADVNELERRGERPAHWMEGLLAARFRVTQALLDGRFDEVEELAVRARGLDTNEATGLAIYTSEVARLRWEQGRMPDVEALVRPLLEQGGERPMPLFHAMLALAELGQDTDTTARRRLHELTAQAEEAPFRWRPHILADLSEVGAALADAETCSSLYRRLAGHAGQVIASTNVPGCRGSVDRYLGMLAIALGRWADADAHCRAALRIETALKSPPFLARAHYWYAHRQATRPHGDSDEAARLATAAQETAEVLGMTSLAEQARQLLHRL